MSFLEFPIRRYQFTLVAFAMLVALGLTSFFNIPRQEDPHFPVGRVRITVPYPGAEPQEVAATDGGGVPLACAGGSCRDVSECPFLRGRCDPGFVSTAAACEGGECRHVLEPFGCDGGPCFDTPLGPRCQSP